MYFYVFYMKNFKILASPKSAVFLPDFLYRFRHDPEPPKNGHKNSLIQKNKLGNQW
jgi:hypothetical protein